ncbi:MAG TPA: PIN domain nuclease [Oligoflexia bacterium]|nr:PIN domain nuclease [Oligoflexia bacterium]HMP48761.1 PIN domain nuclease [Oligoflexia bacterium]
MILVDSSVWIDYFNKIKSPQCDFLHQCLGAVPILTGDIIIAEVLRGFKSDKAFLKAKELLGSLFYRDLLGRDVAILSATIYRQCRKKGITINKPNDLFVSAFCIENKIPLLHSDNDFTIIANHTKLKVINVS